MTLNFEPTRAYLQDFNFKDLFIQMLGWSTAKGISNLHIHAENQDYNLTPIVQLSGIVVFEATLPDGTLPNAKARAAVQKEVSKNFHENLIIFVDGKRTQSLWYWVKREGNRRMPREHYYIKGQPGDLFLGKLSAMLVDISELDENGDINVLEVARRLQKALDVQPAAKKFFTDFAALRLEFTDLIEGISDDKDRRWYASVLLNRLMFIYFLQRKGFIDNGSLEYLQGKLKWSQNQAADRYYEGFLKLLFFEGFAKPEEKRSPEAKAMLGKIKYLNGGLFLKHPVEQRYPDIHIPDKAFENLYSLFQSYSWNLNDIPGGDDKEINPDVLGYIFEKYINQKAFGAYYTRTEITEYLCERTIYRIILQQVNTPLNLPQVAGIKRHSFESIGDLWAYLDAGLCRQLLFEILPKLSLLDPACGSGAFLVAAMKTLINVYSAITGKIPYLNDKNLSEWLEKTNREHPNLAYFIKRSIITDNLYGVDIMDEAAEIARLRLFLALVASVDTVDQLEPLPNIDFNILAGNSLIGLLRINEDEFNRKQTTLFTKPYRQIVDEKKRRLDTYRHTSSLTEDLQTLRDDITRQRNEDYGSLNEMLLDEFSRLGIKYEQAVWDDKKHAEGTPKKRAVQIKDVRDLHPFHWGYEFDEVMNERGGFDAIITNPPWEIFKPIAKEFCYEFDPEVQRRGTDIKNFEERLSQLLQKPEIRKKYLEYYSRFPHLSNYYRSAEQYKNQISIIDGKKAGTDINLYKLFVEQSYRLLKKNGQCGIVIPSGIYSDLGTRQLRELLFDQTTIDGLFCFENRKEIFEGVHRSFKFVILTFEKSGKTTSFPSRFMRHDVNDLATFPEQEAMWLSVEVIRRLSPDSLSIMEFKSDLDVAIAEKMVKWQFLGDAIPNSWNLRLAAELHMTNNSDLFSQKPQVGMLPLYEGKMIWHFEHGLVQPRYWLNEKDVSEKFSSPRRKNVRKMIVDAGLGIEVDKIRFKLPYESYRLGYRSITGATNERTIVAAIIPKGVVAGHSLNVSMPTRDIIENNKWFEKINYTSEELLYLVSVMSSFVCDWYIRQQILTNLTMFYIYQLPLPRLTTKDPSFAPIVERAAKLICTTSEFDELAEEVGLGSHANGVTDLRERARLRAELDGMIAHLYGLTESEFAHILATFPIVKQEVKDAALEEFRRLA